MNRFIHLRSFNCNHLNAHIHIELYTSLFFICTYVNGNFICSEVTSKENPEDIVHRGHVLFNFSFLKIECIDLSGFRLRI